MKPLWLALLILFTPISGVIGVRLKSNMDIVTFQTNASDFEYIASKSNTMVTRNDSEQQLMENRQEIEFTKSYRNKNVMIHLEFPSQSNEKAADDFFSRLKELYLKKMEIKSMQLKEPALLSVSTNEKENRHYD